MKFSIKLILCSIITLQASTLVAKSKKPVLAEIMAEISKSVQMIADGVFTEDYSKIDKGAEYITNHPKPSNMMVVVKELGKDMAAFKAVDHVVHEAAMQIKKASKTKNLEMVLSETNKMMVGCLGCHAKFKSRIQKATGKK